MIDTKKLSELTENILNWAEDRNFYGECKPEIQHLKMFEEVGELASAIIKKDAEDFKDAIGDCYVVAVIYAYLEDLVTDYSFFVKPLNTKAIYFDNEGYFKEVVNFNSFRIDKIVDSLFCIFCYNKDDLNIDCSFEDCIESAYNEIKNRKGKWINGSFIKEATLLEMEAKEKLK